MPSEDGTTRAQQILQTMTLEEKLYQLFCITPEALTGVGKMCIRDSSNSIQNQKSILRKFAEDHHFPSPCFYVDDGFREETSKDRRSSR